MSKPYTQQSNRIMTLTGQGSVSLAPDTVIIRLGVETTGKNLQSIQAENARKTQSVIQSLQRMGITDIKTFNYTIDKKYDYEDGKQIDKGYSVKNILEIKSNNIGNTGTIIDTAVNAGANTVELISFDIENRDYFYEQALNLAVKNAIEKANSISMNLGVIMEPVPVNIVESPMFSAPLKQYDRQFASTPIVPGNINIEAFITAELSY